MATSFTQLHRGNPNIAKIPKNFLGASCCAAKQNFWANFAVDRNNSNKTPPTAQPLDSLWQGQVRGGWQ